MSARDLEQRALQWLSDLKMITQRGKRGKKTHAELSQPRSATQQHDFSSLARFEHVSKQI